MVFVVVVQWSFPEWFLRHDPGYICACWSMCPSPCVSVTPQEDFCWDTVASYLWLIHPGGVGSFAISRTEDISRVERCSMLTVVQGGKVVLVFVALAYWLVSCCSDALWWSFFIEEVKALWEVFADLTKDQSIQPGQEEQQSSRRGPRLLP